MSTRSKKVDVEIDPVSFCADAATVIALRCYRIAQGGPAGAAEAKLMVSEKLAAFTHVQVGLLTGSFGFSPASITSGIVQHYARGVRANRRRLAAPLRMAKKRSR